MFESYLDYHKDAAMKEGIVVGRDEGIVIGRDEGIQIGIDKGVQIGREEGRTESARDMALAGIPNDKIADILKVDIKTVNAWLRKKLPRPAARRLYVERIKQATNGSDYPPTARQREPGCNARALPAARTGIQRPRVGAPVGRLRI